MGCPVRVERTKMRATISRRTVWLRTRKNFGADRVNRTLVGEVQAHCTATMLGQPCELEPTLGIEPRSIPYQGIILPLNYGGSENGAESWIRTNL